MQNEKYDMMTSSFVKENGGYRAKANEYNHIINDYVMRMSVIKESNLKMKR